MRRMIGNNNTAFARFVPTACSFFFFFFFFFSGRELALALPSPRKQKLSNYEVVRFKEVKVDALDESKVESFRVEAFGVSYEVSLEQSYEKLLKNGKVLVDYLGVPQSTDDDADEENAKDSMNEFLEQKAKYCFYRGKVIDSDRTSIVCGNLCDEYLYFNIMAKNSSVSFAMPHADFASRASAREFFKNYRPRRGVAVAPLILTRESTCWRIRISSRFVLKTSSIAITPVLFEIKSFTRLVT